MLMDRRWLLTAGAATLIGKTVHAAPAPGATSIDLARSQTRLGFDLLGSLARPTGTVAASPAGLAAVLSMLSAGADDPTRSAIARIMFPGEAAAASMAALRLAQSTLRASGSNGPIELSFANALVRNSSERLGGATLDMLKDQGAKLIESSDDGLALVKKANQWASDATKGEIRGILTQPLPAGAVAALNALYFKGLWQEQFNKAESRIETFQSFAGSFPVPMMRLKARLAVAARDNFITADLPYAGGRFSLSLLTTKSGLAKPAEFRNAIDLITGRTPEPSMIDLRVPRFDIKNELDLLPIVDRLGLAHARLSPAAFSGFATRGNTLSNIRQQIVLKVDEEGSTAAAATAAIVTRSAPQRPETLIFNRPFCFALMDRTTGLALLTGYVGDLERSIS
jgi:serine protease inhibitor